MDPTRWRKGAVAVTGADGHVGMALQKRLAEFPNEVRPLGRHDDWEAAIRDAEAVVHLAGTLRPLRPNTYVAANLDTVLRTDAALQDSTAERVVFLSYLDADPGSRNPYLRLKAEAEEMLRSSGVPEVIFRCAHIFGPPGDPGPTLGSLLSRDGRPVKVLGDGTQRYSWLSLADVVEAIVHAALDPRTPTGTFELTGPEAPTVDGTVRLVNPEGVRIRHIYPEVARIAAAVMPSLPWPLAEVLIGDCVSSEDPRETAREFGIHLQALDDVWLPGSGFSPV